MLIELALGQDAYPIARPMALLHPRAARHGDRPGQRPAGGGVGTRLPARARRGRGPRGRAAPVAGSRAGLRAGHAPERRRRLAVGRRPARRPGKPWETASDRLDLGAGHLGAGRGRRPGVACPTRRCSTGPTDYLAGQFAQAEAADTDTRAALLHALSTRDRAELRAGQRPEPRPAEPVRRGAGVPGPDVREPRSAEPGRARSWACSGRGRSRRRPARTSRPGSSGRATSPNPSLDGRVEATALAALAYARSRPNDPILAGASDWLLAHRIGTGWLPHKADGPALAALSAFYGSAGRAEDRYRLTVTVNDQQVFQKEIVGDVGGRGDRRAPRGDQARRREPHSRSTSKVAGRSATPSR